MRVAVREGDPVWTERAGRIRLREEAIYPAKLICGAEVVPVACQDVAAVPAHARIHKRNYRINVSFNRAFGVVYADVSKIRTIKTGSGQP